LARAHSRSSEHFRRFSQRALRTLGAGISPAPQYQDADQDHDQSEQQQQLLTIDDLAEARSRQSADHARTVAEMVTERLKVFAQPQRLMILSRLLEGERTVGGIDEATGIGQPALSQQLSELRRAGLAKASRVAKQVFYRLADSDAEFRVRSIEALFGAGPVAMPALESLVADAPRSDAPRPIAAAAFATIG
jgi:DNA-binding transcriptional ArsR family regulator